MSPENFVRKYGLKKKTTKKIKLHEILEEIRLDSKVGI